MFRPSRPLASLLLALAGCTPSGEREAPRPPGAPVSVPAPKAASPRGRKALPPEPLHARRWLVIVHGSATPGEGGEVLEALARTGLPAEPVRLSSTAFQELRPCLELVVARSFPGKAEAVAYQGQLLAAGVAAEVRYAGPLEAGRAAREASCLAAVEAHAVLVAGLARRETPRFVESHVGRTFLLLGEGQESRVLEPMDVRRGVWMAPAGEDPTGLFSPGDRVDLYGPEGPLHAGCAVKGFMWINRGVPPVEFFLREPPPEAPGCGGVWAFAELDCEVKPGAPVFALPAGTAAPVFFPREPAPDAEEVAAEEAVLRRSERFAALRLEGTQQAERTGETPREEVASFGFAHAGRRVLFTQARLRVGEGHSVCGIDFDQQVTRAVVRAPGEAERVLPPLALAGEDVVGVLDLEGDGRVELLMRETWPAGTLRLVREDGTEVAGDVVENCDSGC